MDEDVIRNYDVKDVTSNLYRIVPDVRDEIITAITAYRKIPVKKHDAALTAALMALESPIDVTAPPAPTVRPINVLHSDAIKEANFQNTLTVIKKSITIELERAQSDETREALTRLLSRVPDVI